MTHFNKLVLGGGISAIAWAHFYPKDDYMILEKSDSLGGLCKSFKIGESIFDYSGHFMHFKNKEIEEYVTSLLLKHKTGEFKKYDRNAGIGMMSMTKLSPEKKMTRIVGYPFQANIHHLEYSDFIKCLVDLWNAPATQTACRDDLLQSLHSPENFEEEVRRRFGDGITDLFFKPYNEKLYCTPLKEMDADAMKRFIPKVRFDEVISNFKLQKEFGYNSTFLYSPTSGIQGLVDAFLSEKKVRHMLNEEIVNIDLTKKIVKTRNHAFTYDVLVNTLPLNLFAKLTKKKDLTLKSVDVHVYNITFQSKSSHGDGFCWLYFPDESLPFYRVGFYNYMSGKDDTSIYVEVSTKTNSKTKVPEINDIIKKLMKAGIVYGGAPVKDTQKLVISPAYAILEKDTEEKVSKYRTELQTQNVYLTGRYGKWEYSSIEDAIVDAKQLATNLSTK